MTAPDHAPKEAETVYYDPVDVRTDVFADLMADYPYASEVDSIESLPYMVLTASDDGEPFTARVLGWGTSYRATHVNHEPGAHPAKGVRCSGCRWTDTAILAVSDEARHYVLVTLGRSSVPGEEQRTTVLWATDAADVLRALFVRTKPGFKTDRAAKAIPPHNGAAFREAACVDTKFAALVEQFAEAIPAASETEADPLAGL